MKLVDTNVLLYVVDEDAPHHQEAVRWIEAALSRRERVLFPWLATVGFIRLVTGRSLMSNPLDNQTALELVDAWLSTDAALIPVPDESHLTRVDELLRATGRGGNIVNDAHLAAIALQYDASVVSFDNDFGRFPGVRWERPV